MADSVINQYLSSGTAAERVAFTPNVPSPVSIGNDHLHVWYETDTLKLWVSANGGAWEEVAPKLFRVLAADPGSPTDGDVWIRDSGTETEIRFQKGGVSYTLAGVTIP